jgi:2-oxo-4-hydroxy-4-carboxy-5-ureidoimidazoline decarboxylase
MTTVRISLLELNRLSMSRFVEVLKDVFEHSSWVAEQAVFARPFQDIEDLHVAMVKAVQHADQADQLKLIRARPQLAGGNVVRDEPGDYSAREQVGAGLEDCTSEELETLTALNEAYNKKFGFPFVLAVNGLSREQIIQQLTHRLDLGADQERQQCLTEIYKIARFRLDELIHPVNG